VLPNFLFADVPTRTDPDEGVAKFGKKFFYFTTIPIPTKQLHPLSFISPAFVMTRRRRIRRKIGEDCIYHTAIRVEISVEENETFLSNSG